MDRCPTCKAGFRGKRVCHRCRMDLGMLLDLEAAAQGHLQKAISAYSSHRYAEMLHHARRSCSLRKNPAAIRVLACAALLNGRFSLAASFWREVSGYGFQVSGIRKT